MRNRQAATGAEINSLTADEEGVPYFLKEHVLNPMHEGTGRYCNGWVGRNAFTWRWSVRARGYLACMSLSTISASSISTHMRRQQPKRDGLGTTSTLRIRHLRKPSKLATCCTVAIPNSHCWAATPHDLYRTSALLARIQASAGHRRANACSCPRPDSGASAGRRQVRHKREKRR